MVDAFVQVGGVDVARGTALYLRKGEAPVDDAPLTATWDSTIPEHEDNPFDMPFEVRPVEGMGFGAVRPAPHVVARAPAARHRRTAHAVHPGRRRRRLRESRSRTRRAKGSSTSTPTSRSTSLGFPKASGSASSTPTVSPPMASRSLIAGCTTRRARSVRARSAPCAIRACRGSRSRRPSGHRWCCRCWLSRAAWRVWWSRSARLGALRAASA